MKKNRKLKPIVLSSLFAALIIGLVTLTFLVSEALMRPAESEIVNRPRVRDVFEESIPVVDVETRIIKPFTDQNVIVAKPFYDFKAESEQQEHALTFFNNIYMQNSGVSFILESGEVFEVVSVLSGTVVNVRDDETLGKTIEIKHDNDLITIYQSLSEVTVRKGDEVTQGQIIGRSGTNKIAQDLGNHLHFEIHHRGRVVNPEEYFGKEIDKLN